MTTTTTFVMTDDSDRTAYVQDWMLTEDTGEMVNVHEVCDLDLGDDVDDLDDDEFYARVREVARAAGYRTGSSWTDNADLGRAYEAEQA